MKRVLPIVLTLAMLIPYVHAAPAGLQVNAASSVLMEKETGTVLYENNAHEKLEPASVTKVMTLLLTMEALADGRIKKEDMVSTSAYAASMGGSQVFLEEGEQMSVHDLLKCIAVSSANDAAVAMAEHLTGSEAAFVEKMNARAAELGMNDTHFSNCTGLPVADHYTSAYDIALMSRQLVLNHPDIQSYSTIWMDTIRGGAFGLSNTNRLIRFYNGATGLKTGFTDSALYCLSATAERNGMELIAAVMKSPTSDDRFQAAKTLMDYGFANYSLTTVHPDRALAPVTVLLGEQEQVQPRLARECRLLLERSGSGEVATELLVAADVAAPVEEGQQLGKMIVRVNGEVRDEVPIVADRGVNRLSLPGIFLGMFRRMLMAG
ncbi:MAG: D-alanyl-D-alanine carboxypeptidase [Ruminococcaceae bacterium]|nr:D-alanyl-D-alanine carboxypeptidase [Oscillospiraceae bacterium]